MKIEGVRRLLRQLDDLPQSVRDNLKVSIEKTVAKGVSKGKAVAPVDTGDFKNGIKGNVEVGQDKILGFINFYDGSVKDGLAASSINYGWGDMPRGFFVREQVKTSIAGRHKRQMKKALQAAIKDALNG